MMIKSHQYWMDRAIQLAEMSLPLDVPVAALIVDASGTLIAEGYNTRERDQDPSGHAEIVALKQAGQHQHNWRMENCILYVTLEPCPMCASALLQARISTIVYGAADPIQGALGSALNLAEVYPQDVEILGGILEQHCQSQLHQFFKHQRLRP